MVPSSHINDVRLLYFHLRLASTVVEIPRPLRSTLLCLSESKVRIVSIHYLISISIPHVTLSWMYNRRRRSFSDWFLPPSSLFQICYGDLTDKKMMNMSEVINVAGLLKVDAEQVLNVVVLLSWFDTKTWSLSRWRLNDMKSIELMKRELQKARWRLRIEGSKKMLIEGRLEMMVDVATLMVEARRWRFLEVTSWWVSSAIFYYRFLFLAEILW